MNKELVLEKEWYNLLVEDCKAIVIEHEFISRWAKVEGHHALGERIVNETNLNREDIYGKKILSVLSKSSGIGERTLYRAIQFYKKYPILNDVPEGKAISWNKIITKYLPERTEKEEKNEYQRIFKGIERWSKSIEGLIGLHDQDKINYHVREIKNIIAKVSGIANKSTLIIDQSIPADAVAKGVKALEDDDDRSWMKLVD